MKRNKSLTTILRFPLLFGGFLGLMAFAFIYRENWLGDIDRERDKLYKHNIEHSKIIEELKRTHGK